MRSDVRTYWDEIAREFVSSAGLVNGRGARNGAPGCYRSAFLDELEDGRRPVGDPSYALSSHPGMRAFFASSKQTGGELYRAARAAAEAQKASEAKAMGVDERLWTGMRKDVPALLAEVMERYPFEIARAPFGSPIAQQTVYLRASCGLNFYCGCDLGGLARLAGQLPLVFWIGRADAAEPFALGDLHLISMGMEQYFSFGSALTAVVGLHALVAAFDAMAGSFEAHGD